MRRLIYGISTFMFLFVLSTGLYNAYRVSELKEQVQELETREEDLLVEIDGSESTSGYYLQEKEGLVYVYKGDQQTLYEKTAIPVSDLPRQLQQEIKTGKHLKSELELYGFLENYSS